MKKIALYLTEYAGTTLYRYDKTRFCLVYDEDRFISVAENLHEKQEDTIYDIIDAVLMNYHE